MEGRMRVSVVATGIDVVESARETPRPARRPTELRAEAELPAPEPVAPAPVEAPAPAPEHAFPPAAQAREAEEDAPSLFGGLEDQPEPAQDDALPPPAYAAARAAAARRPGEGPDAEALNRLQAAVSRARPETAATPAAPSQAAAERSRFGIGSLINRMSGHGGDVDTPRPAAAAPPRPRTAQPQAPQPRPVASAPPRGYEDEDADHERIEIPAFLRRQAN
jgi:cell division protein FtsZ